MESQFNNYNYLCINSECNNNKHQHIKKTEAEMNDPEPCIECGKPMKLMGEMMYGGVGGNFRLSTPEQRRKILQKRSSEHFRKSGLAERKRAIGEQYKREAINHFRG